MTGPKPITPEEESELRKANYVTNAHRAKVMLDVFQNYPNGIDLSRIWATIDQLRKERDKLLSKLQRRKEVIDGLKATNKRLRDQLGEALDD